MVFARLGMPWQAFCSGKPDICRYKARIGWNMVIGVGTDLIEIGRIQKACERKGFLAYVYTEQECRQARESYSRLAGNFAVKEGVAKALGTGFRGFRPTDVEVLRDGLGKPYVRLYGGAKARQQELGIARFHVSISNTAEHAMAFVVGEGERDEAYCDWGADEGN